MGTDAEKPQNESKLSEDWLKLAIDHIPKPIFFVNIEEKRMWFSNRAAKEMLGLAYEQDWDAATTDSSLRVFTPDGSEVAMDELPSRRAIRGEFVNGDEYIIQSRKGRFYVRSFVEQLPAAYDRPRSAIILLQDITALKSAAALAVSSQEKAQLERMKYEEVLKQITVPIILFEGREHRITFVNEAMNEIYGLPSDVRGRTLTDVFPDAEKQGFRALLDRVYQTGETIIAREARYDHKFGDGRTKTFYLDYTFAAKRNSENEIEGVLDVTVDVTRHVELRREVERSREQLENERFLLSQIFMKSPAGMTTWMGEDLVFDRVNPGYQKFFPNRQLVGKPLLEALPELRDQGFAERIASVLLTGVAQSGHETHVRIENKPGVVEDRYYNFVYEQLRDIDQKPIGVYDHAVDVTETVIAKREMELARKAAETASQAKSQFLANMSHEIRTPLGAIMGFASLLKDRTIDREQIEGFVSVIERNSSQLLRIIDDILDLSKVEAGMLSIETIEFSLPDLLTDFSALMGFKAREKGIGFSLKTVTPLPRMVRSDPTRLRQILVNVVGNAIKFTEKGRVELRCCFSNGRLDFEVEDSGRGISDDEIRSLFQPFAQADSSITRKYGGTGLGLVLTRNLAEALGGSFDLKSSVLGQGSVFDVTIATEVSPGTEFVKGIGFESAVPKPSSAVGELTGLQVLLVEDSPDNQAMITIFLGRAGATTDVASDGAQGLEMALRKNYDLILMDLQMPVMDGLTAIKRLRKAGYTGPVVALTAHAMKEERERCLEAGFDDFLSKPVPRDELIAKVKSIASARV